MTSPVGRQYTRRQTRHRDLLVEVGDAIIFIMHVNLERALRGRQMLVHRARENLRAILLRLFAPTALPCALHVKFVISAAVGLGDRNSRRHLLYLPGKRMIFLFFSARQHSYIR